MENISVKRTCNALIEDAQAGFCAYLVSVAGGIESLASTVVVLAAFKKAMGGLWVGGTVLLTSTSLQFRSNAVNNFFHSEPYFIKIPLSDISSVNRECGFVTGIICVGTPHGSMKIRCFKAKDFAQKINEAVSLRSLPNDPNH